MAEEPSTNGANGRNAKGQFMKGNAGGPGNPNAKRAAHLRQIMYDAVSDDDLLAIIAKTVEQAREGDAAARKELLDRLWGKAVQALEHSAGEGGTVELVVHLAPKKPSGEPTCDKNVSKDITP